MFDINPALSPKVEKIGLEKTSIIVIDDFFLDYELARQEAIHAKYAYDKETVGEFYPGARAPLRKDYGIKILQYAARVMHQCLGLEKISQVMPINANYSLITKAPQDLDLMQSIPHFDTTEPLSFAVLHYMNEGEFGGTAFYSHRPSGFENITPERKETYLAAMQKVFDDVGPPKRQYFCDSDHHYQLIHKVDYRRNRVVVYPTSILHSAYIDDFKSNISSDPNTGRLSSNFLFKLA